MNRPFSLLLAVLASGSAAQLRADDDKTASDLEKAKAVYAAAIKNYPDDVKEWFKKQEDAARELKSGAAAKLKQIEGEQAEYEKSGVLPKRIDAAIRARPSEAAKVLVTAYGKAADEYASRGKAFDVQRKAVVKELDDFKKAMPQTEIKREKWIKADKDWFELGKDGEWSERSGKDTYTFKVVERTAKYTELHDASRQNGIGIRLYDDHADVKFGKQDWKPWFKGRWEESISVIVPPSKTSENNWSSVATELKTVTVSGKQLTLGGLEQALEKSGSAEILNPALRARMKECVKELQKDALLLAGDESTDAKSSGYRQALASMDVMLGDFIKSDQDNGGLPPTNPARKAIEDLKARVEKKRPVN